jgi:hypothetical protein
MALIGAIITLVSGDDLWLAFLGLALFGSNLVASLLLGIGAFRGVAVMRTRDGTEELQGALGQEDEGEDSEQESGED